MRYLIQSLAVLTVLLGFNNCTTFVEPTTPTTTTTTHTTENAMLPGASVTTRKSTTTY